MDDWVIIENIHKVDYYENKNLILYNKLLILYYLLHYGILPNINYYKYLNILYKLYKWKT